MKAIFTFATAASIAFVGSAMAQEDFSANLKARQGQFRILAINLGILGDMAKGKMDYDAAAAEAAAHSIHGVSMVHQAALWPEGSDNMSIDGTRALPMIWDDFADFSSKWDALGTAAENLISVAGTGQEAIGPALGQIGGTCKACHDTYRASAN